MTGWIELLSSVVGLALFCLGLTLFVFALVGIQKVFDDYKESKWQRKYGKKLKEESERNQWENMERLRDRVLLLEETVKENGIEKSAAKIDEIISGLDYDVRYNVWKKNEDKWRVFALSSMSGGFGSTEKAQAEVNEDFNKYEEQRRKELRRKLDRINQTKTG
jgi:hypothetical protein